MLDAYTDIVSLKKKRISDKNWSTAGITVLDHHCKPFQKKFPSKKWLLSQALHTESTCKLGCGSACVYLLFILFNTYTIVFLVIE